MFCPVCKAEYRQGFEMCDDCNVSLVAELPPEPETEFVDYVEVLSTFNPAEIALIKSLLDSEDITYFIHGENFVQLYALAMPARMCRSVVLPQPLGPIRPTASPSLTTKETSSRMVCAPYDLLLG